MPRVTWLAFSIGSEARITDLPEYASPACGNPGAVGRDGDSISLAPTVTGRGTGFVEDPFYGAT